MSQTICAISFDAHGTIILPDPSVGAIYAEVAIDHHISVSAEELDQRFAPAFRKVAKNWDIPYGSDENDAKRFWHAVIAETFGPERTTPALQEQLFLEFSYGDRWRLLPGVHEACAYARKHDLALVVCSNFDHRVVNILTDHAIDLDHIFTSAQVGVAKPNPALLLHACQQLNIAPHQLLHIGDNPLEDGPAALTCGCQYLEVERGAGIRLPDLIAALGH